MLRRRLLLLPILAMLPGCGPTEPIAPIPARAEPAATQANACQTPPTGLVAWWPGEGSAADAGGRFAGLTSGPVGYGAGEVGSGFFLDANPAEDILVSAAPRLNVGAGAGLTLEAWIEPMGQNGRVGAGAGPIMEFESGVHLWQLDSRGMSANGSLYVNLVEANGVYHIIQIDSVVTPGVWNHVAVTYDRAAGVATLFVNGDSVGSANIGSVPLQTAGDLHIGHRTSTSFNLNQLSTFNGGIDEADLFDRALTPAEIRSIYAAGAGGKCPPNHPPVADAGGPYAEAVGVSISLSGAASTDPDGDPLTYDWDFGDGTGHGTGAQPSHAWGQAGMFTVTLVVTDPAGAADTATTTATISVSCLPPPAGLVGWWQGEGNALNVVNGHDASLLNGLGFGTGRVGDAFRFDGIDDGLEVGTVPALDVGSGPGLTLAAWIFSNGDGSSQVYGTGPIFEYSNGVHFWQEPGFDNLWLNLFDTQGNAHGFNAPIANPAGWNHVAATYDKASGVGAVYVNGLLAASASLGTFTPETATDLYVGVRPSGSFTLPGTFNGLIDEPQVYDRALTPSEVAQLAGHPGHCGNLPPVAEAGGPYAGTEGALIGFDASASTDPEGAPLTYAWDLDGDGTFEATGASVSRSFPDDGSYPIRLRVSDGLLSSTSSTVVSVVNASPIVDAGPDAVAITGTPLTLLTSFTDAGSADAPWATSVVWGDGTSSPGSTGTIGPILAQHTYAVPGTYVVTVSVSDKDGGLGTDQATIAVAPANRPPVAGAGGPYSGSEGGSVAFTSAGSTDPDGDALSYSWTFGDGGTGSGVAPSHVYADNGSYTATVTVSDGKGGVSGASATVTVSNLAPTASFTSTPSPTTEGSPFMLTLAGATDPSSVDQAAGFTYAFDCGTGSFGPFGAGSSLSCPTVDNGPRTVRGQVRDKDGGTTTYSAQQRVTNVAPTASIVPNGPTTITRGGTFKLNATFVDPGTVDNPWTISINWGNGTTTVTSATQWNSILRQRVYAARGAFTVRMTVKDKNGASGTSNAITVRVQ